jgi:hypothetical protein
MPIAATAIKVPVLYELVCRFIASPPLRIRLMSGFIVGLMGIRKLVIVFHLRMNWIHAP